MAADSSFDVVSKVDRQEVDNALNQAAKEIAQRYDFKGVGASIAWSGDSILMIANSPERVKAVLDVFQTKLIRRGVSLKAIDTGDGEPKPSGKEYRLAGTLREGLNQETAKKITKLIRDQAAKGVKTQITGDEVRVSSKSRDDLQDVIALLQGGLDVLSALQQGDDVLEVVAGLRAHPHLVTGDLGLHALGGLVADQFGDLLRGLLVQALPERSGEPVLLAGRLGFAVTGVDGLEGDPTPDELGLEDVEDGLHSLGRVGDHEDRVAAPGDGGAHALEVVALGDLLGGLVEGVVHLLPVDLADDVERGIGGHGSPSRWCWSRCAVRRSRITPFCRIGFHTPPWKLVTFKTHHTAGYPSGQRELTVNQLRNASGVRIPHPPQHAPD